MELFESLKEGKDHSPEQRVTLGNIKKQALNIYQTRLNEEIKLLVRSERYTTLAEAIKGATVEEKVKGANNRISVYQGKNKYELKKRFFLHGTIQC